MASDLIGMIAGLTDAQCADVIFIEHELIPALGLNDEALREQPPELAPYFGQGLRLWQYPNQLAPYLVWLAQHAAGITSYMEIGCHWGGMVVLTCEWLRRHRAPLKHVIAVDMIQPRPLINPYLDLLRSVSIRATYLCAESQSADVANVVEQVHPDLAFVDGDHELPSALADHMMARQYARIIVHHDICSEACPDTTQLWQWLKVLERHDFDFHEFTRQYPSTHGQFLGIGAMVRKEPS